MPQTPHLGDLVETPTGLLGILVSDQPCTDTGCRGQIQVRLVTTPPGTQPLCYVRRDVAVVAPAAHLAAS